ncbi:MAG: pilus assembly protein TadG-related protein [Candidatus Sulfotelmatobacter sp.]
MKTPLMKTRLGKKLRNESGQALIITIICLTVLLGFVGFAVDLGYMFYVKRQLQTAADSAALAGASILTSNTPTLSIITTVANHDAALNGVTTGSNGFTVTVTWPYTPASLCANCTSNNFVEVAVSQTQKTGFMSLFGTSPTTVAARAVAFAQNSPGCMFTLNQNGAAPNGGGIFLNGLALFVNAPTCAIYIDSPNNTSALNVGSSFIASLTAKSIGIVGNPGYNRGFFSSITPTPVGGMVPVSDPLAYLNPPALGACLAGTTNVVATTGQTLQATSVTGHAYCGTGGNPAIKVATTGVTFGPGTYVLNGGGFVTGGLSINAVSANAAATGTGVTFYMYNGASFSISGPGSIFSANGITLTAPSPPSAYAGILFYQDRADAGTATLGGYFGKLDLEGAIYIPDGTLSFPAVISATTLQNNTILVANAIQFVGILGFFQDYDKATGSGGISPIKTVVLTE